MLELASCPAIVYPELIPLAAFDLANKSKTIDSFFESENRFDFIYKYIN